MRKILSLLAVLVLSSVLVFAQTRSVSGTVTDEKGDPIPYASIVVKGKAKGATADADGKFVLTNIATGAQVVISAQGHQEQTVTVGNQSLLSVSLLKSSGSTLSEVVVTGAFNIKRSQRAVAYNAQNVNAEQLNTIRQTNVTNALSGKVAGLQVLGQSSVKLGADADQRLGGATTLGGGGVIYVVDGTIVSASDINPDDVEDVTVYSGVAATALFGDRAIGGAVVINSKRAKKTKGIGIQVNTGITFDQIYVLPKYQNEYAGGGVGELTRFDYKPGMPADWQALDGKYYHDYSDDASWGPRMVGQDYIPWYAWYPGSQYSFKTAKLTPQPDNIKEFYNTGVTTNNNVNFTKSDEGYRMRVSYTNQFQKGLLPGSDLRKNIFSTQTEFDLGKHFTLNANLNYVNRVVNGEFSDGYANQSTGSFSSWFHRHLDMDIVKELKGLRSPEGILASWNHNNPGTYDVGNPVAFYGANYWYNFYTYFDQIQNRNNRERLYGDVGLTYKLNNNFRIRGTYRQNYLGTSYENKTYTALQNSGTQTGTFGGYSTGQTNFKETNYELVATYTNKLGEDFSTNINAGGNILKTNYKDIGGNTVNGFNVPDLFALNNSKNPIGYFNNREAKTVNSLFARGDVGFRNMLFAEFSVRQDWSSTLPKAKPYIFYKSFGGSFVFSELLSDNFPALSFGKIRGSWGEVPQTLGIYANNFAYGVAANQWSGNFLMGTPDVLIDPQLIGATQNTFEIGSDLKFFRNRLGLAVTYQKNISKDIPIQVEIGGTSGYTRKLINAGRIEASTLFLSLTGRPVQSKDFTWDITLNFSKQLDNKIVKLAPGVKQQVQFAGAFSTSSSAYVVHREGEQWGQLIGGGIKRIDGKPVLDASGLFVKQDNVNFGSILPEFLGGLLNNFSYKNFVAQINIDYSKGGKYFSLSDFWGSFSGLTARTVGLNDKGNPIRDAVADGGGIKVMGVDADGKDVEYYVEAQDYHHQFRSRNISEMSVYDLDFIKLREVSVGYKIPVQKIGNLSKYVQNATFSLVARNPWLIYAKNRDFDPSELSAKYGEDGQFPGTRSFGFNLSVGF